jgi:hypothetical protein
VDSNQDAIEVFQKALLQAQNNAESKQEPSDTVDENLDSQVVFSGKVSSDSATGAQLNPFPGIGKKRTLPSWALFLSGLLVLPLFSGIVSSILIEVSHSSGQEYFSHDGWTREPNITIQNETYSVREYHLGIGFEEEYPGNSWDIVVEGDLGFAVGGNAILWGNYQGPESQHQAFEIDGETWYQMHVENCRSCSRCWSAEKGCDCSSCNDVNVFIKIDGAAVDIATNSSNGADFVGYWSGGNGEIFALEIIGFLIVPISFIGGIIWGFKTDRKPFAYGIISAVAVAFVVDGDFMV